MKLLKRVGFYLVGVALGSIVVLFIWKGKDVTFDYGPNARTLKSIRKKNLQYSPAVDRQMRYRKIDTTTIKKILTYGEVDFSKSKPRLKPCAEYYIDADSIQLYVKRCDSIATIEMATYKY